MATIRYITTIAVFLLEGTEEEASRAMESLDMMVEEDFISVWTAEPQPSRGGPGRWEVNVEFYGRERTVTDLIESILNAGEYTDANLKEASVRVAGG